MIDEHIMRQWNEGHTAFSEDIDRRLAQIAHRLSHRERQLFGIDEPYGDRKASPNTASSLLIALAACATSAVLFLSVGVAASPPGLLLA